MAESKVKSEQYITIQGWMIRELGLKGNELMIYAIIYGYSQAENQVYTGSLQYLSDWTNSTKQTTMNCLKSLESKGLIVKRENYINNVKFCEYYAKNLNGVFKKFEWGIQKILMGGIQKILPNNIDIDNIEDNIEDNIGAKSKKKSKNHYGEYGNCELTDDEYSKLITDYNESIVKNYITRLDEYIEEHNKQAEYKKRNHNLTLRNWMRKDNVQKENERYTITEGLI